MLFFQQIDATGYEAFAEAFGIPIEKLTTDKVTDLYRRAQFAKRFDDEFSGKIIELDQTVGKYTHKITDDLIK